MFLRRLVPLAVLLLGSTIVACAQDKPKDYGIRSRKALSLYEEGLQQSQWRAHRQAANLYEQALEIEPDFAHAHFRLGVTAFVLELFDPAVEHLQRAQALKPKEFPMTGYYLGTSMFYQENYASAAEQLQAFLALETGRRQDVERARNLLKHALFAKEAIRDSVDFEPRNLGAAVNSQYEEYLPYLTADGELLLFTSRRPESIGGYQALLRDFSEDFFVSEKWENGDWSSAENLGAPINSEDNEGAAAMSQDGRMIIFTACNRSDGVGNCDLYLSYREGDRWSEPRNLGAAVNSRGWDSQPCLSHDGRTLYFASARTGGSGGRDIWSSTWDGERWTEARNLGEPVNSPGNEDSPFLHADGLTLYFSSDFHPGFGKQDLFVSYRREGGAWADPINLGYPLNTAAEESNIFVGTSGREGYINSDREGGLGGSDLYAFTIPEAVRPQISTFVRGVVQDSVTGTPVFAAVQVVDVATGDTLRDIRSGRSDGKFLMSLPGGREYAAFVQAPRYLFASRHFSLTDLKEGTYFDLIVKLKPIEEGISMVLPNVFYETGRFELKSESEAELLVLYRFLERNPGIRIEIQGHTDNVGNDADNLTLSRQRAEAVQAFLVEKGIAPERLQARGYGETRPVADNDTETGRAKNRRTEIQILPANP